MLRQFSLVVALLLCGARLHAQTLENLVTNGDFARGIDNWKITAPDKQRVSTVEANIGGATRAVHLEITVAPDDKPWAAQLRQTLNVPWKKGEAMKLEAWMRSPQSIKIRPIVEAGATDDFAKSLSQEITLSPEWTKIEVSGAATKEFAAGDLTLGFQLGYGTGSVEMTAIRLQKVAAPDAALPIPNLATLDAPQSLIANGDFAAPLDKSWVFSAQMPVVTLVDVAGQSFGRALHLEMPTVAPHPWDARASTPKIGQPLAKGALVAVQFWARSPQKNQIGVRFQKSVAPFDKIISQNVVLTPDWTQYRFYARVDSDLPPDATQFEFHLGFGAGAVELANVRVENFGAGQIKDLEARVGAQSVDYWGGQTHDDAWKTAAFARIEKYRKGDIKLRVVDGKGQPIAGAKIKLVQTRQLFHWGSAVNAARLIDVQDPDNLRYQAEVKRLFNTIVFENDLKWRNDSAQRTQEALQAAQWLRANDIEIRGHNLVWGARKFLPAIVADNWDDTEKLRQIVRDHVRETVTQWKGQIYVWDAVNEAATNTELWDKLGWDEFANVFRIAREADPKVKLAYNDYNIANESQSRAANSKQRARVIELVQLLRDKGAPVDILADQAHFSAPLTPPARVVEIWAEMAKLGLPLEITEFDTAIPDDAVQADYVRDILIAAFAEPKIESFLMWGFWEGAHWRAKEGGAMFRQNWTPRPAQLAYEDLVLKQWMTNAQLQTDKNGVVQTRGFLGDYQATLEVGGREKVAEFSLSAAGLKLQIAL